MDIGIITFATDRSIAPDVLGAACEERGFESLWFAEHTHIPTSRKTPFLVGEIFLKCTGERWTSL